MVGVGIDGKESSLARVSIVNYHGAVQLDEFVRQKERVVDYRTEWSGIRPTDMVKGTLSSSVSSRNITIEQYSFHCITAKSFEEVQKQVAALLKDRILVGHAVHNDLKVRLYIYLVAMVLKRLLWIGFTSLTSSAIHPRYTNARPKTQIDPIIPARATPLGTTRTRRHYSGRRTLISRLSFTHAVLHLVFYELCAQN